MSDYPVHLLLASLLVHFEDSHIENLKHQITQETLWLLIVFLHIVQSASAAVSCSSVRTFHWWYQWKSLHPVPRVHKNALPMCHFLRALRRNSSNICPSWTHSHRATVLLWLLKYNLMQKEGNYDLQRIDRIIWFIISNLPLNYNTLAWY